MISFLRGQVKIKFKNGIILELNNIGYSVFLSDRFLNEVKINQNLEVFTLQYVKEDIFDLYGFETWSELEFFELLISISGIGPKSALGILSMAKLDDLKESIVRGDSNLLTKVSGIGKKTAERVVLELKDKIMKLGGNFNLASSGNSIGEEIEALVGLGYSWSEAREALKSVGEEVVDSGERIKQALKKMSTSR